MCEARSPGLGGSDGALEIPGQPAAATEPCEGALDEIILLKPDMTKPKLIPL